MSQIPRRTTLSMTQTPKVRKTPSVSPAATQPTVVVKRQEAESPRSTAKSIGVDTPILIEDTDFGDTLENHDLVQVLSSVEEKNGINALNGGKSGNKEATVMAGAEKITKEHSVATPPTNGVSKLKEPSKRSKSKKAEDSAADDNQSSSTSIRSSVESSPAVDMDSLLIPDDDDLVLAVKEKSVSSYDSPRPNKTPGKIVRLAKGSRISPFRKVDQQQPLDNVSTIVNLSTVSEQSMENNLDSPVVEFVAKNGTDEETVPGQDKGPSNSSSSAGGGVTDSTGRRISARRTYATNRPLREMSFRNATRDAYKKNGPSSEESSNEAVNDSVNATVGSELGFNMDDLPETPAAGQKRRRDSSDGEDEAAPEPKKSLFQTYCVVM